MQMTWSTAALQPLLFKLWEHDEQIVVFNPSAGDTHLVDEFGMALLRCLESSPHTLAALTEELAEFFEDHNADKIADYIDATLRRFQHVGLVIPASH
jgi:PqqD family protein of HPr-rel-A system